MDWKVNFSDGVYKVCYVCKTSFAGLHLLTKHLRSHVDVQCLECPKRFASGLGKAKVSFRFEKMFEKVLFFLILALHEHLRIRFKSLANNEAATKVKEKIYKCREVACAYACYTIKMFIEHMDKVHDIKKPFVCDQCGVSYKFKANLDEHKAKHSSTYFACDKCDKKFQSKSGLYVHRRDQHTSIVRSVKCDVCSFVSKGMRNLKKHKETHNKASYSRYPCLYCYKTFRNRNSLNVHVLTHNGVRPFSCNLCKKTFKRSHHLYSHLKCVDHRNKLEQRKTDLPDPIYSVTKPSFQPSTIEHNEQPIYMEVTDANGSNSTVQVVSDSITADQFAVLLASTDEYKEYILSNENEIK